MADPAKILAGVSEMYPGLEFIGSLYKTMNEFPDAQWEDALSRGQIQSKWWLVNELEKVVNHLSPPRETDQYGNWIEDFHWWPGRIYICASWYGILAEMILHRMAWGVDQIRGLDIDPHAVEVANRLMRHRGDKWKFKSMVKDIHELTFDNDELHIERHSGEVVVRYDTPDTIINTSCEHITEFDAWYDSIPRDRLVVMQSNDFFDHPEHVNCSKNLSHFSEQTPMNEVFFSGQLDLTKYNRFMRIGFK